MDDDAVRRRWLFVGSVAVVILLIGLGLSWYLRPTERAPEVLVVGDSVSYLTAPAIQLRFGADNVQFIAKPGYTSGDLLPLVTDRIDALVAAGQPLRRVAVLVGYNDVRYGEEAGPALPLLMKESARFRCAVWLTVPARPGGKASTFGGMDPAGVELWNQRIRDEAAKYPNVKVDEGWKQVVERAPAVELLEDGVHPNVAGQRRLADAYWNAVDRRC